MHIVLVEIHVKPEQLEAFKQATFENARNSIHEPGILQFDFIQQANDPTRFKLVEVYRSPEDQLSHRETAHYKIWKDTVAEMMAEPRAGTVYVNLFPPDEDWKK